MRRAWNSYCTPTCCTWLVATPPLLAWREEGGLLSPGHGPQLAHPGMGRPTGLWGRLDGALSQGSGVAWPPCLVTLLSLEPQPVFRPILGSSPRWAPCRQPGQVQAVGRTPFPPHQEGGDSWRSLGWESRSGWPLSSAPALDGPWLCHVPGPGAQHSSSLECHGPSHVI